MFESASVPIVLFRLSADRYWEAERIAERASHYGKISNDSVNALNTLAKVYLFVRINEWKGSWRRAIYLLRGMKTQTITVASKQAWVSGVTRVARIERLLMTEGRVALYWCCHAYFNWTCSTFPPKHFSFWRGANVSDLILTDAKSFYC
jgi:hypothetical protein